MQEILTYKQLEEKARKDLDKINKVAVGIWAKINRYKKTRKQKDNIVQTFYIKEEDK